MADEGKGADSRPGDDSYSENQPLLTNQSSAGAAEGSSGHRQTPNKRRKRFQDGNTSSTSRSKPRHILEPRPGASEPRARGGVLLLSSSWSSQTSNVAALALLRVSAARLVESFMSARSPCRWTDVPFRTFQRVNSSSDVHVAETRRIYAPRSSATLQGRGCRPDLQPPSLAALKPSSFAVD